MKLIKGQQAMLDIVFANRNKQYGAYAIRKAYDSTIVKSLFIVCFTLASCIGLIIFLQEKQTIVASIPDQIVIENIYTVTPVTLPEPESIKSPKEENNTSTEKNKSSNTVIIKDNAVDTAKATTIVVPINTNTNTLGNTLATHNGTAAGTGTTDIQSNNPLDLYALDENPEFEGGLQALLNVIRKNLVYPTNAFENQKQGTLHVKFVVDETGKISNIELMNKLGYGLDAEAIRVVNLIPNFKSPGKVKGKAVKTYYQLPIKFKLG